MRSIHAYLLLGILLSTGMVIAGCETMDAESGSTMGATQPRPSEPVAETAAIPPSLAAPPDARTAPAAGAVDDSLQACMARIPQDSTPSQRMLGERTCQRDEETRQPYSRAR